MKNISSWLMSSLAASSHGSRYLSSPRLFTRYQVLDTDEDIQNIFIAADVDNEGNVYLTWSNQEHIFLGTSMDQGASWITTQVTSLASELDILTGLQKQLRLNRLPLRIECFDNSNLAGKAPVASMVVFEKGKAIKSAYRRYKIKTVIQPDDYAYMAEVLRRRYGKGEVSKPFPDLLIVDGGKGQLNIAGSVLEDLGLEREFEIIGIAKKDIQRGDDQDKVYRLGRANPINFGKQGNLLLFLQKIRDESHRFAISFHRKRRTADAMRSALDKVPGVGKKRKKILMSHFKSIKSIRMASPEELSALPGISLQLAGTIKETLDLKVK